MDKSTTPNLYKELLNRIHKDAFEYIDSQYHTWHKWFLLFEPFVYLALAITSSVYYDTFGIFSWIFSAVFLFFYYVRMGFLGHDIIHGQLFKKQKLPSKIISWLICSFGQGISEVWWNDKHNDHHKAPNGYEIEEDKLSLIDSDIDTMPFLLWDASFYNKEIYSKPIPKFFLKYQDKLIWPLLSLIRPIWAFHSLNYKGRKSSGIQKVGVILHFTIMFSLFSLLNSFPYALALLIPVILMAGMMIGIFSLFSHAGLESYEYKDKPHPFERALTATRNVRTNIFVFWISGGLANQIEHHLYASLPRHALRKMSPIIEKHCLELGLPYMTRSTTEALGFLPKALREVRQSIK